MAKIVVIDGLARSGTTLLASLIHSQLISTAYRGVFHEPLGSRLGKWKKDYALHDLISTSTTAIANEYNAGAKHTLDTDLLISQTLKSVHKLKQYDPVGPEIWDELRGKRISDWSDLDDLYQDIARVSDSEILGFRWNQGLCWVDNFLRNENHFWISVVRHPLQRAISDKIAFRESLAKGIRYSQKYGEILSSYQNPRHKIIFYEDLISNPVETCLDIFLFLKTPLTTVNLDLKNQSGGDYRVESSSLGRGKKRIQGYSFQGFEKVKAALPRDDEIPRRFRNLIEAHTVYRNRYGSL